MPLFVPLLFLY